MTDTPERERLESGWTKEDEFRVAEAIAKSILHESKVHRQYGLLAGEGTREEVLARGFINFAKLPPPVAEDDREVARSIAQRTANTLADELKLSPYQAGRVSGLFWNEIEAARAPLLREIAEHKQNSETWAIRREEQRARADIAEAALKTMREDVRQELLNTPELSDFTAGVTLEALHQRERWGAAHDRSKSAENWFWLVGYLAGKALRAAAVDGDKDKALHHTISAAAALSQWHAAIIADPTGCGQGADADLQPTAALKTMRETLRYSNNALNRVVSALPNDERLADYEAILICAEQADEMARAALGDQP